MNEFTAVLEMIRTDFADAGRIALEVSDLQTFMQIIKDHRLGTYMSALAGESLPSALVEPAASICASARRHYSEIRSLICRLTRLAENAGLRFIVIKGIGLNRAIYGADIVRSFGDLDILAAPEDAMGFHQLFTEAGFFQKFGMTRVVPKTNRCKRAHLAMRMKTFDARDNAPFPVKAHQDKPEYKPYCIERASAVEMHDGLYFLSAAAVLKMRRESICTEAGEGGYQVLSPMHAFILLLTNTYENSESFFSNSYDFGIALRDYVDIRFFFKKYHNLLDWQRIEGLIDEFEIRTIAETVMGNLAEVYGRDVTEGCLPGIRPAASEWGVSVLDRMGDFELARSASLRVMRGRWLAEGAASPLYVCAAVPGAVANDYQACAFGSDARFHLTHTAGAFVIIWAISALSWERGDAFLYQLRFFPVTDAAAYTAYKADFFPDGDSGRAYGHSTKGYTLGAIRKETGYTLPLSVRRGGDMRFVQMELPFAQFGGIDVRKAHSLCVSAEVFNRHYEEIYHRMSAGMAGPAMRLIVLQGMGEE